MMEMVSGSSCKERVEENKNQAENGECTVKKKIGGRKREKRRTRKKKKWEEVADRCENDRSRKIRIKNTNYRKENTTKQNTLNMSRRKQVQKEENEGGVYKNG